LRVKSVSEAAYLFNSWNVFEVASTTCVEAAFDVIKSPIMTLAFCKSEEVAVVTRWTANPTDFGTVFIPHLEGRVMTDLVLEKKDVSTMHGTVLMATTIDNCVVKKMGFAWIIVGTSGPDLLAATSTQLETFWMALLASFELSCGGPTLATFLSIVDTCWEGLRELLYSTLGGWILCIKVSY